MNLRFCFDPDFLVWQTLRLSRRPMVHRGEVSIVRVTEPGPLKALPECNPPPSLPRGNVGTSLGEFRHLISSCQLPPGVIKKLGLRFPTSRRKRRYGSLRQSLAACCAGTRFY